MMHITKQYKKIVSLFIVLAVFTYPLLGFAYNPAEDIVVSILSVKDDNGNITEIVNPASDVVISVGISNWSFLVSPEMTVLAAVYDKTSDKMKVLESVGGITCEKYYNKKVNIAISSAKLTAGNTAAGDKIRLFLWDNLSGMQQLANNISSDNFASKKYSTNNVSKYNAVSNQVRGDNWSYAALYGKLEVGKPVPAMGLCVKSNVFTPDDNWYNSANKKERNWFLEPSGRMSAESSRPLIWIYTIGDIAEGQELKVSGTFTGASSADLHVLKTKDEVESISGYGISAVAMPGMAEDYILESYPALAGAGGKFEFTIPAEEAKKGNDILFWVAWNAGGYIVNTLNVTIEAVE